MASRLISDLLPEVADMANRWVEACRSHGVEVLVYCTYRSATEQALLYEHGRGLPGPIVTNAPAWGSWHQFRRALDAVPMRGGKPIWQYSKADPAWATFASEARKVGFEWAGDWKTFREYVHVQHTGGLTLAQAYAQLHGGQSHPA